MNGHAQVPNRREFLKMDESFMSPPLPLFPTTVIGSMGASSTTKRHVIWSFKQSK
jgi:hypothetical protein